MFTQSTRENLFKAFRAIIVAVINYTLKSSEVWQATEYLFWVIENDIGRQLLEEEKTKITSWYSGVAVELVLVVDKEDLKNKEELYISVIEGCINA